MQHLATVRIRVNALRRTMSRIYDTEGAAKRYDAARSLPQETSALWMATLEAALPRDFSPATILDLGAGTGRFALPLYTAFHCPIHAVEPSAAMLAEGRRNTPESITWHHGSAEDIPLESACVDLVWMSQVFHHLESPGPALHEIRRVLRTGGCLAIRNGTKENNAEIPWMRCFPEAEQIDEARLPSRQAMVDLVIEHGFSTIHTQTVYQYFAASYAEYYEKISCRGLSSLIAISDEAFEAGLRRLRDWVDRQPLDKPVTEPVDLFVFQVGKDVEIRTVHTPDASS
jgi:ubiquinone/menaquinone biosynthesis C-methylase UbiE